MAWVNHELTISRDWSWAAATGWKVTVSKAVSGKSRSFQSQLAAGQVAATLPAPTSCPSSAHVPPRVSVRGLWLACDRPHPSTYQETTGLKLPVAWSWCIASQWVHFPFFFSLFVFCFFGFLFFFPSPVHLRTLLTHIWTPSSHAPTFAWPEAEAAVPLQGLDNGDHAALAHVPPMVSMCGLWSACDQPPFWPTKWPLVLNWQRHQAHVWVHLVCFFSPFFFVVCMSHQWNRPAQRCHNTCCHWLGFSVSVSIPLFFSFFSAVVSHDKYNNM